MSGGVVFCFFSTDKGKVRVAEIQALARSKKLGKPTYRYPDALDAAVASIQMKQEHRSRPVALCGSLEDLHPPVNVDTGTWANSLFYYLEEAGIPFYILGDTGTPLHLGPQGAVIRQYHKAMTFLKDEVRRRLMTDEDRQRAMRGAKYGRPSYGYRMSRGRLVPNKPQVAAIKEVFRLYRKAEKMPKILCRLQSKFGTEPDSKNPGSTKKQYWDHVKVNRILSKANLYCKGEYTTSTGEVVLYPDLAILPPDWVDTWSVNHKTTRPSRPAKSEQSS
jgi:hypothetical protein